ncbi:MAG: metallopeptidase TldD-related protein [Candidatus Fermentibacter sp.]|nr:metallopeptidase TldD-related protein [Candidatus Fermentibacter sp.]
MTREEMLDFVQQVLGAVSVGHSVAELDEERVALVRFGRNSVTQNMDTFRRELRLWVGDGSRKAEYRTHRIDAGAIPEVVRTAEQKLRMSSPDPEYVPPADEGQIYPLVDAWDEETGRVEPGPRMDAASAAVEASGAAGTEAAGTSRMESSRIALATSTGNLCFHEATEGAFQITVQAGSGSSYRSVSSKAWRDIPVRSTIDEVIAEAKASRDPSPSEPGSIDVVLEPQAVADLVPYMLMSLDARTTDEGITVFGDMEGKRVASEEFTLESDLHGEVPGRPFDGDGLATEDQVWIDSGILRTMMCDRFWAEKSGRPAVVNPGCFGVRGAHGTASELAAQSGRCLRIRRLWYIRYVDQKSLILTGMTRDGVFLCENGSARPVEDFRWNWRPLDLLSRIEALGTPERKGFMVVPPMLLRGVPV